MEIINNIKKNNNILIVITILYISLFSLFSKHYNNDDNFSGTFKIVNPIIQLILLTLMMISFGAHFIFYFVFTMCLIFYFKDDLFIISREAFGCEIEKGQLKGTQEELKLANQQIGKLESDKKQLEKDIETAQETALTETAERKSVQRDLDMVKGTNDTLTKEGGSEKCKNAKEVLNNKTEYTSKVQRKAQKTMEDCMENFSNLAGFKNIISNNPDNYNSVDYMISNFKNLHVSSKNKFENQKNMFIPKKHTTINDKITTESRLLPVNTRYF